ncbi:hypothetical protein Tco_0751975 [Tanacetum coccineum]|uniref:Uncharacterized protein n=1 Tax=Tanacetum coccineum TaxID=301880 RepID=A0ABQ4Z5J2_9ASTR
MIVKILGSSGQKVILASSLVILLIHLWLLKKSSKLGLQSMTPGQISLGLDLTYAPSTITTQKPTERELKLLFEAMYDDYLSGQPSVAPRPAPAAPANQNLQTSHASITIQGSASTPTYSSSQPLNTPNTSQDVDEPSQQHVHQ